MTAGDASKPEESFEAIYSRLEETVQQLEEGGLAIDRSIELFEVGMRFAKQCRDLLDGAELRVSTLTDEFRTAGIAHMEP